VQVVLTAGCNLSCAYCFENARSGGRMDWDVFRPTLDLALASSRPRVEVLFYGGEPLLEFPAIRRGVEYVRRSPRGRKISFGISTNGLLLDREASAFFERHEVGLQLSFDGVPPAQDVRGVGTFGALDALLKRLAREQPRWFRESVSVAATLTPGTVPYLAESVRYFHRRQVATVDVAPVLGWDAEWRVDDIEDLDRQFSRVFDASLRHYHRTGDVPLRLFRKSTPVRRGRRGGLFCAAATGEILAVDVDGGVFGCVALAESYRKFPAGLLPKRLRRIRLGNLRGAAFEWRLRSHPAASAATGLFRPKVSKLSSYGRCMDCRHVDDCLMCPEATATLAGNDDSSRNPDFLCAFYKVALAWRERFPNPPDVRDILLGRAPVPPWIRRVVGPAAARLAPSGKRPGARSSGVVGP
jgi:sulfatase maturation enzyme AslB (radical SAM superfamily)